MQSGALGGACFAGGGGACVVFDQKESKCAKTHPLVALCHLRTLRIQQQNRRDTFRSPNAGEAWGLPAGVALDPTLSSVSSSSSSSPSLPLAEPVLVAERDCAHLTVPASGLCDLTASTNALAANASVRALFVSFEGTKDEDEEKANGSGEAASAATAAAAAAAAALGADRLRALPIPVLATVDRPLSAAASALAMGADLRYANENAKLCFAEETLSPAFPLEVRIRECGGERAVAAAATAAATDGNISARDAAALCLLDSVGDDPAAEAAEFGRALSRQNPDAVTCLKSLLQRTWHAGERESLLEESRLQRELLHSFNMARKAAAVLLPKWVPIPPFRARKRSSLE